MIAAFFAALGLLLFLFFFCLSEVDEEGNLLADRPYPARLAIESILASLVILGTIFLIAVGIFALGASLGFDAPPILPAFASSYISYLLPYVKERIYDLVCAGFGCVAIMGVACSLRPPLMLLWRGGMAVARAFGRWGGDAAARIKQFVVARPMFIRFIPAKLDASTTARESKKERKARAPPAPAALSLWAFGAAAQIL
ncbi:hypothetical protein T484DRAFT_1775419 [Baffinella frigidus]|nr:hypothetical protein T484DRAFT_1775419 [Cryptophyta sp. CCMP2293]